MKIGVIGGSGLYDLEGIKDLEPRGISTPFGSPSDEYLCGSLQGVEVCFLPRLPGVGIVQRPLFQLLFRYRHWRLKRLFSH